MQILSINKIGFQQAVLLECVLADFVPDPGTYNVRRCIFPTQNIQRCYISLLTTKNVRYYPY